MKAEIDPTVDAVWRGLEPEIQARRGPYVDMPSGFYVQISHAISAKRQADALESLLRTIWSKNI